MTVTSISRSELTDAIAQITGSRLAEEVVRKIIDGEPDLILAHYKDSGRLRRTQFAYRPGVSGMQTARNAKPQNFPPAAVSAADNPGLAPLWLVR